MSSSLSARFQYRLNEELVGEKLKLRTLECLRRALHEQDFCCVATVASESRNRAITNALTFHIADLLAAEVEICLIGKTTTVREISIVLHRPAICLCDFCRLSG